MRTQFQDRNLIEMFNRALDGPPWLDETCIDVIRTERTETMTFRQLKDRARRFASWLIASPKITVGRKVAVLGKNRIIELPLVLLADDRQPGCGNLCQGIRVHATEAELAILATSRAGAAAEVISP